MQPHRAPDSATTDARLAGTAMIAIGSNMGDRERVMRAAIADIAAHSAVALTAVSSLYETAPVGPPGQGLYLNACARLRTALGAAELLHELLAIERRFGRVRDSRQRWGPRTLDLDLLLMDDLVIDEPGLTVPHPRLHERLFVLTPLAEIAPDAQVPGMNARVGELLALALALDPAAASTIVRYAPAPSPTPDMLGA